MNKITRLPSNKSSFLQSLLKNSKLAALFILDQEGFILEVNDGVERNYGYTPEDIIGKHFSLLFTQEDRINNKPASELSKALKHGSASDLNFVVHKNGSAIWTNGETVKVTDDQGEISLIKNIFDISQEKVLENFLVVSEAKQSLLANIFDTFLHGIVVLKSVRNDANKIIDFECALVNKTAEKLLGKTREELIGKRLLKEFPEVGESGVFDSHVKVVETGEKNEFEFYFGKHGFNNWFKLSQVKFGDGYIATFDDITERKTAHLQLEKATTFLLETQEVAQVGSFEWDIVNDKISGTPEYMKLFNYKEKEHSFQDFLNIISPEDKDRVEKSIKDALENKTSIDIEYKLIYQDGSEKYFWDRARISYNEEGKPVRSIGTVADISKLKKIERDLKTVKNNLRSTNAELEVRVEERTKKLSVVNEELNRMNNELDKYAYIISHDLKAPLNSIDGLIAMVKDDYKDKILEKDGLDMLEMMNTKVQDMRQLIDESLLSAKAIKTIKEPINLYHLTQEVIDTLNPPPHFHIFIQHTLPMVLYNRSSLIRVLQNLLGNAIKYMNNEHPLIKVACIEHNNYFQICVSDNGPGIPKEKQKKIFEIFEVAHSNNEIESHGLGLSIVKQIAEENGGRAWVDSAEGEETHFYFTIPKN